jgi:hypothetical protein
MAMKLKERIESADKAGEIEAPAPRPRAAATAPKPGRRPASAPSKQALARDGKKAIVGYFDPPVNNRIRQAALNKGTTVQALVGVGINRVLVECGLKPFPDLEVDL